MSENNNYLFAYWYKHIENEVHEIAKDKGWWDEDRNDAEMIALMHSELSEALEFLRKNPMAKDDKIPAFKGIEAEFADVIIRIMDTSAARGWRVADALLAKMEYNRGRRKKHGKRF